MKLEIGLVTKHFALRRSIMTLEEPLAFLYGATPVRLSHGLKPTAAEIEAEQGYLINIEGFVI